MNSYTCLKARVCSAPKLLKFGERDYCEVRFADNPRKKTKKDGSEVKPRFITAKVWGPTAVFMAKLSVGDVMAVSGELGIDTFKAKDGKDIDQDVLEVSTYEVHKSETFYAKGTAASDLPF